MSFFITKKSKHAMKERRKKKLLAEKGLLPPSSHDDHNNNGATTTGEYKKSNNKRSRSEITAMEENDSEQGEVEANFESLQRQQPQSASASQAAPQLQISRITSKDTTKHNQTMKKNQIDRYTIELVTKGDEKVSERHTTSITQ
jgi:hypothetical protein